MLTNQITSSLDAIAILGNPNCGGITYLRVHPYCRSFGGGISVMYKAVMSSQYSLFTIVQHVYLYIA